MTYYLAHISDVHLAPLPPVRVTDLMSKRITGYVNWKRNRAAHMESGTLDRLVAALGRSRPDHIAVTGDLTNLALDAEISNARDWLRGLGDPADVTAVPGNHDAYVRGALASAVAAWSANMSGDDDSEIHRFPFLRNRGPVAVIGVNSAVATAPFLATGRFSDAQAAGLARLLDTARAARLFRVILIHHPPVAGAASWKSRLHGIRLFQSVIREHGAELVLHGHTHLAQRNEIPGPDRSAVPVIGVPAAGESPGGKRPGAAFNLFEIGGKPGRWTCVLEEHSLTGNAGATTVTERRELFSRTGTRGKPSAATPR